MVRQVFLSRVFLLFCILAAVGPGRMVMGTVQARSAAKRISQFGPLPELPITWMDWLLGICALILLTAALMELMSPRRAPPLAFLATTVLWIYFGPGVWAHMTGSGFFEPTPGYATYIPWQQCLYQIGATVLAALLTYQRHRNAGAA